MDKSLRQKINRETEVSNDTLDPIVLIDLHRTFHPKQENLHSFYMHMEHFPGHTTCWATK